MSSLAFPAPPKQDDDKISLTIEILQANTTWDRSILPRSPISGGAASTRACIDVMTNALTDLVSIPKHPLELAQKYPKFMNHITLWALSCKSAELLECTKDRWMQCQCDLSDSRLYALHTHQDRRSNDEEMEMQFFWFAEKLFLMFDNLTLGLASAPRSTREIFDKSNFMLGMSKSLSSTMQVTHGKNPGLNALTRCFALSPGALVRSCMAWIHVGVKPHIMYPIRLLAIAYQFIPSPQKTQEYFRMFREFPQFPAILIDTLHHWVDSHCACTGEDGHGVPVTKWACSRLGSGFTCLDSLNAFARDPNSIMHGYLTAHAKKIFTTIYDIVCALQPPGKAESNFPRHFVDEIVPQLGQVAKSMYPAMESHEVTPQVSKMYAKLLQQPRPAVEEKAAMMLLACTGQLQHSKRCLNPPCFPRSSKFLLVC